MLKDPGEKKKFQDLRATYKAKTKQQYKIIYRVKIHKQSGFWEGRTFPFLYHLARVMYSNEGHQEELWVFSQAY